MSLPAGVDTEIYRALRERSWSREGARFIAEHIHEDEKYHRYMRRRLLGEKQPRRPSKNKKKSIPHRLRKRVYERDAYRCQHCSDWHDLSIDHIIPESKGGPTTFDNLQTLCMPCNMAKGDDLPQ